MKPIDSDALREKFADVLNSTYTDDYAKVFVAGLYAAMNMPTLTPPNEWVSVEDELPKLPDCDRCSMMVNTARKGNPKSLPMIYERAIVRGKRVERWKYYWDRIAYEPPDYWMYLPEPPKKET